jgi:hypothetical protein
VKKSHLDKLSNLLNIMSLDELKLLFSAPKIHLMISYPATLAVKKLINRFLHRNNRYLLFLRVSTIKEGVDGVYRES